MRDRLTKQRRSWNMSRIRGKHTAPEKVVRSLLHRLGYRFRLHVRILVEEGRKKKGEGRRQGAGVRGQRSEVRGQKAEIRGQRSEVSGKRRRSVQADILLPKHKTAIFVHGCFWHRHRGCKNCTTPTNRREWWLAKLNGNAARDKVQQRALRKLGWRTLIVWECQTEKANTLGQFSQRLAKLIN